MQDDQLVVRTIGHSNRSLDTFLDLARAHEVARIVDVRAFPGSRRLPQFGRDTFADSLEAAGFDYRHEGRLGGRRKLEPAAGDDVGGAWRHMSFRAYAQWTRHPEYQLALRELIDEATTTRIAIMCSEAVPWRCHRWLVSDTLVARGAVVHHIMDEAAPRLHLLSSFATVDDGEVRWPGPTSDAPLRLGPRLDAMHV
jgi:uncharacterized protein (DUF488 family)